MAQCYIILNLKFYFSFHHWFLLTYFMAYLLFPVLFHFFSFLISNLETTHIKSTRFSWGDILGLVRLRVANNECFKRMSPLLLWQMSQQVRHLDKRKINEQHNISKLWFVHIKIKVIHACEWIWGRSGFYSSDVFNKW